VIGERDPVLTWIVVILLRLLVSHGRVQLASD